MTVTSGVPHILVVEDDREYADTLIDALSNLYHLDSAKSLKDAKRALERNRYDLILLDVNLPDGKGFSLIEKHQIDVPVIFLTADNELSSRLRGIELGAEDYLLKPFDLKELVARIQNRLRKSSKKTQSSFQVGNLKFNTSTQQVWVIHGKREKNLELTRIEFKILFHFAQNENEAFTRAQIISAVWGDQAELMDRTVDTHISAVRRKIGESSYSIRPVYGVGYRFSKVLRARIRKAA